jgi:sterol desaturase/sphingolipid hydroxylase (fatty acid hydroxylase superfamily)
LSTFPAWWLGSRQLYWVTFLGMFLAVAAWEALQPVRASSAPARRRWGIHAVLFGLSDALQSIAVRVLAIGAAGLVQGNPLGLFNRSSIPFTLRVVLSILLLDFVRYGAHRLYHAFGALWRVHEIHHSDPEFDVSTATRFHPLELLPCRALHLAAIIVFAPPLVAVLISELMAMLFNFIQHANASFPKRGEPIIRLVFITPDLHRIHHSDEEEDYGCNFGQTFSLWDRLFDTYAARSHNGEIVHGVKPAGPTDLIGVTALLRRPFR